MRVDGFGKTKIEDFTRQEFLDFVTKLDDPTGRTEAEDSRWIRHFDLWFGLIRAVETFYSIQPQVRITRKPWWKRSRPIVETTAFPVSGRVTFDL